MRERLCKPREFRRRALGPLGHYHHQREPYILPDLRKALSLIRRNNKRMGILRRYEIVGSADNEISEIKAVWIIVHISADATPEKMVSTRWELDSLILREFACKLSKSMVMVAVGA